jgi:hypothetical protein
MNRRRHGLLDLAAVTLVPAAVTVLARATKSFWGDEILSLQLATAPAAEFASRLGGDLHPPLYFVLLRGWVALWGDGETALRIFQGLQGVLLLDAALRLFRRLLPGQRFHPGFLLFGAASELWLYLPMLRYYVLAATLAVAATSALLAWLERPGLRRGLLLGLAYAAILYTDYPTAAILPIHLLYVLVVRRAAFRRLVVVLAAAGVAFLPWVLMLRLQMGPLLGSTQAADLGATPAGFLLKLGYGLYAFLAGETQLPGDPAGAPALVLAAALLLWAVYGRGAGRRDPGRLALATVLLGLLATGLVTTFVSRHTSVAYTAARTLYALPFFFVLAGAAGETLGRWPRRALWAALLLLAARGDANWVANRDFVMPVYAVPWRAIARTLDGAGGVALVDESHCYLYYRRRAAPGAPPVVRPRDADELRDLLAAAAARHGGPPASPSVAVALIRTDRESTRSEVPDDVVAFLGTRGRLVGSSRWVEYSPRYRRLQEAVLHRPSSQAKVRLDRYLVPPP